MAKPSDCPKHFLPWPKLGKPKSLANGGPHMHSSSQNNGPHVLLPLPLLFFTLLSLSYQSSCIASRRLGGSLLFACRLLIFLPVAATSAGRCCLPSSASAIGATRQRGRRSRCAPSTAREGGRDGEGGRRGVDPVITSCARSRLASAIVA